MANFTNVTITEARAFALVRDYIQEMLKRAFTSGEAQGADSAGRPIVFEGVGAPWPELHRPPYLADPDVVTTGSANGSDELRIVNYALGALRAMNTAFSSMGLAEPATLANVVVDSTLNLTLQNISTELQAVATAWNANQAALQGNPSQVNPNFPEMPTTVTLP